MARKIAKDMGGTYLDPLGGKDIEHPLFDIEVKNRKRWVSAKWMEQAEANADPGKMGIVVVHLPYLKYRENYAILRLGDLEDLLGEIKKGDSGL